MPHRARDMGMSSISARVETKDCVVIDSPERSMNRIMALPVRYRDERADGWYCPPKMAHDVLTPDELDKVVGYVSHPMRLGVGFSEMG